ncbi:uncharacterized protein TRIADDRAFT_60297 [Trichoplax adhaerens]|uniref:Uncharacterized protein n=1 Tax=Trichoplax adhaerens TaxID=10228 RepID=B3S7U5_TRIAD|nr:predicted protein [Trichoplax adhaerens]EDV21355.1 predicted protein [Trichoplax adhaerens]|eukprot:XP_002116322.1 predicted protein [Trichoplax adhaerens]
MTNRTMEFYTLSELTAAVTIVAEEYKRAVVMFDIGIGPDQFNKSRSKFVVKLTKLFFQSSTNPIENYQIKIDKITGQKDSNKTMVTWHVNNWVNIRSDGLTVAAGEQLLKMGPEAVGKFLGTPFVGKVLTVFSNIEAKANSGSRLWTIVLLTMLALGTLMSIIAVIYYLLRTEETSATMTGNGEAEKVEYGTYNNGLSCKEDEDNDSVYENLELHIRKETCS